MVILEPVEAQRYGVQSRPQQRVEPRGIERHTVRHHAPRIAAPVDRQPRLFEVAAHQNLTARKDYHHLVWVDVRRNGVQHPQEILQRHIGMFRHSFFGIQHAVALAVASAVAAIEVTTQGTLPKQGAQRVVFHLVFI